MLKKRFKIPISALDIHPSSSTSIALGFIDGSIHLCEFGFDNGRKGSLERLWTTRLKRAVRDLKFSEDGSQLYVVGTNWSLSVYDVQSGKRLRCVRKCHNARPNRLCVLPSYLSRDQVATGSEDGEIKLWDFRLEGEPLVQTFKDQEDIINDLKVYKHWLLSACGDGTLAAYDLRKRKLSMLSEVMHSELMSIAVTDKYTYVGGTDGFIEVFINGQYGNLLERIETPFDMGVDCLLTLRPQLLLAGSSMTDEMRYFHVNPNKQLKAVEQPGGVDILMKSADSLYLVTIASDSSTLLVRQLPTLIKDIPTLRSQEMREAAKSKRANGLDVPTGKKRARVAGPDPDFFRGLCEEGSDDGEDQ